MSWRQSNTVDTENRPTLLYTVHNTVENWPTLLYTVHNPVDNWPTLLYTVHSTVENGPTLLHGVDSWFLRFRFGILFRQLLRLIYGRRFFKIFSVFLLIWVESAVNGISLRHWYRGRMMNPSKLSLFDNFAHISVQLTVHITVKYLYETVRSYIWFIFLYLYKYILHNTWELHRKSTVIYCKWDVFLLDDSLVHVTWESVKAAQIPTNAIYGIVTIL